MSFISNSALISDLKVEMSFKLSNIIHMDEDPYRIIYRTVEHTRIGNRDQEADCE
jgi:hypothetical protein